MFVNIFIVVALSSCLADKSCPPGFVEHFDGQRRCYSLSKSARPIECPQQCQKLGSTLAIIGSPEQSSFMSRTILEKGQGDYAYVSAGSAGENHSHDWLRLDGISGQSDNLCGDEDPADTNTTGLNDTVCHQKLPCLCETSASDINFQKGFNWRSVGISVLVLFCVGTLVIVFGDCALAYVENIPHAEVLLSYEEESQADTTTLGSTVVDTSMLTGLRAILMMTVAINHFTLFYQHSLMGFDVRGALQGGAAVTGFFCLSGFLMAIAYGGRDFSGDSVSHRIQRRNFYAKRIARLAPLYYFSLLISVDQHLLFSAKNPIEAAYKFILVLVTLTSTQAWLSEGGLLWNGPLWSVSTIAFFYMRFPYLVPRLKKWQKRRRAMRILALAMFLKYGVGDLMTYYRARFWPPCQIGTFLLGVLAGLNRTQARVLTAPEQKLWARYADGLTLALVVWLVSAGAVAFLFGDVGQYVARNLVERMIALPFTYWLEALTVAGKDAWTVRILNAYVMKKAGSWSYGVYCLAIPVWAWHAYLKDGRTWFPDVLQPLEQWLPIASLFVSAWVANSLIEVPLQGRLQRWLCVHIPPTEAPPQPSPAQQPQTPNNCLKCMDIDKDGELDVTLVMALSCPCCIPQRECCCFNPCNPCAGAGNCCIDWCNVVGPPHEVVLESSVSTEMQGFSILHDDVLRI